jgi:quercetin dioxygenase-like cupin family protein
MIRRWREGGWEDVPQEMYKDEPGIWMKVSREVLFESEDARFQSRCFRIEPGGFTSFEKHGHEHFVMVISGQGEVFLHGQWSPISERDVVAVGPWEPHQFRADAEQGMDILCVVNSERDRPVLLQHFAAADASNNKAE